MQIREVVLFSDEARLSVVPAPQDVKRN